MHSEIAIEIDAAPALVFALVRDVERWDRLLPHYVRSRAVERRLDGSLLTDFVARRPLLPILGLGVAVIWRSRTWSEPETRRLRFVHVAGATKGMDVTWRIEPLGSGGGATRITIEHEFTPRLPLLAVVVDRWFTRPIAGRTLATFKALAEALAEVPAETSAQPSEAEAPYRANPPG